MNNYRIFVEKRPLYRVEAESMRRELNEHLGLAMGELRLLNVYDLFGFTPELLEQSRYRVFGEVVDGKIVPATAPAITSQCIRVPVTDGHLACVFVKFDQKPTKEEILARFNQVYINHE